jgi:hypothetical protein
LFLYTGAILFYIRLLPLTNKVLNPLKKRAKKRGHPEGAIGAVKTAHITAKKERFVPLLEKVHTVAHIGELFNIFSPRKVRGEEMGARPVHI